MSKAAVIVLDGCGVGELPDAAQYGDGGSNTLGNLSRAVPGGLDLPNLGRLGLGNIIPLEGMAPAVSPLGGYGKMAERSAGKDSTSGHWEMSGLVTDQPLPIYPRGFPPEVIEPFKRAIGRDILANQAASGTEIIQRLGDEHLRTGYPIVYTSADSVFQIACHEEVVPLETLYQWCRMAREILSGPHAVGRVIARPFTGTSGNYQRMGGHRQDFSLKPPRPTLLDIISRAGLETVGVGKIHDLFAGQGLTTSIHSDNNDDGTAKMLEAWPRLKRGLMMANLVDFDMAWGHRNDAAGFYRGLQDFDRWLPSMLAAMGPGDLLVITADHGNDPTTESTDHSREYAPLLICGPDLKDGVNLGTRDSFADLSATLADYFGLKGTGAGRSFWDLIKP